MSLLNSIYPQQIIALNLEAVNAKCSFISCLKIDEEKKCIICAGIKPIIYLLLPSSFRQQENLALHLDTVFTFFQEG